MDSKVVHTCVYALRGAMSKYNTSLFKRELHFFASVYFVGIHLLDCPGKQSR